MIHQCIECFKKVNWIKTIGMISGRKERYLEARSVSINKYKQLKINNDRSIINMCLTENTYKKFNKN